MATREQITTFAQRLNASRARLRTVSLTDLLAVILPPLVLLAVVVIATIHFLRPFPPQTFTMAIGGARGAYADYANAYRRVFAKAGITLRVVSSGGAADSLAMVRDAHSGIDAAILQDGLAEPGTTGVLSAGAIEFEPIWIFYRNPQDWTRLSDLAGKRVNIGRWGAGTQPFALELLKEGGLSSNVEGLSPPGHNVHIFTLSGTEALEALKADRLDAVITLGDPDSTLIDAYFHTPGVKAMPMAQAEAVARHRPFLHHVKIPRGGIDLPADLPSADLDTVATTSVVYVREDLHPALVSLLASAMSATHQDGTLLGNKHEFPSDLDVTVPPHPVAGRFIKNGPPFLMRYLPFWLATLLDRTFVVLIPLFALLLPVSRVIPQVYAWRIRRKLDRWYAELKALEAELDRGELVGVRELLLQRTDWIERQVAGLKLPLSFSNQLYILKEHLELVRRRVLRRSRPPAQAAEPEGGAPTGVLAD